MDDGLSAFHFGAPLWLWALLLCIPVALWLMASRRFGNRNERIRRYADAFLLPHLLGRSEVSAGMRWVRYVHWAAIWTLLVLAMAGPSWDYTDVQLFRPGTNLVVLFDLSHSMDVTDVKPSRLARAQQELADLLERNRGIRIGVIGFASIAQVIAPLTEDMNGIRRVLPALDTRLVQLPGSRPSYALERAGEMIAAQPKDSVSSILFITDGDFDDPELVKHAQEFKDRGIRVHVLGIGTPEGGEIPAVNGPAPGKNSTWLTDRSGKPVISALNESLLKSLAWAGGGIYQRADFRQKDTDRILGEVRAQALPDSEINERTRVWNEHFQWLAGLALLLLLPLFRRTLAAHQVQRP